MNTTSRLLLLLFLAASVSAENLSITFQRQDFTGQWYNSILHFQNSSRDELWNATWQVGGTIGPKVVEAGVEYHIVLTLGSNILDKGSITFTQNGTLPIQITSPIYSFGYSPMDGILITTWQNKTLEKTYCTFDVNASLTVDIATYNVYNASVFPPAAIYTASFTGTNNGSFQFSVPNINNTYKCECILSVNNVSYVKVDYFSFGNFTARFMGSNAPAKFLGYSTDEVFQGVSLFLVVFVLGIGSQATSSIMTLFGVGLVWLFYYWGWMVLDPIILGFLLVFAVVYRFQKGKEGKG